MISPEERIEKMSKEDKDRVLMSIFSNPNFDPYFTWLDTLEISTQMQEAQNEKMKEQKNRMDLDEFFKNMKTLSEAGDKFMKLQKTIDEMRKSFDKDELLRETEKRLGAKRGSIEQYAKEKKSIKTAKIQGRVSKGV